MTKDESIDSLWERSNHGTQREDIEAAFNAGVEAAHKSQSPPPIPRRPRFAGSKGFINDDSVE